MQVVISSVLGCAKEVVKGPSVIHWIGGGEGHIYIYIVVCFIVGSRTVEY